MFPTGQDFAAMVQASDAGILIHEAESKNILWANDAACQMFGFALDELRPLKAHHMSSPDRRYRREVGVAWLHEAVVHGSSRRRWMYRAKDGTEFLTDALATLVHFQDGQVVMVTFRAVTAEDALQSELSRAADYLQRLMETASAGIVLLDEENRVEDCSAYAAKMLGTTPELAIGRRIDEFARFDPPLDSEPAAERLRQTGRPTEFLLEVTSGPGTRWVSADIETVPHDGIESRLAAIRDVTERVQMTRRSEAQQSQLQYMSRYNAMGDMAMTIAHELGQPLAAARNSMTGIKARQQAGKLTDEDLSYGVELAERQLARAADIVSSVKRYVQRIETSASAGDFNAAVRESLYFARLRGAELGIAVEADLRVEPLPVQAEHILIGQVVLNLCYNALDEVTAANAAGLEVPRRIWLSTYRKGDWAVCAVSDQGRGMPADLIDPDTLRSAFSRSNAPSGEPSSTDPGAGDRTTRDKAEGAGIGLVISERIVERHGGELRVTSPGGVGTRVAFRIPIAPHGD